MMDIRIKKYKLRYGGKIFSAGAIVSLPDEEAKQLVAQNPREFEVVSISKKERTPQKKQREKNEDVLPAIDLAGTIR